MKENVKERKKRERKNLKQEILRYFKSSKSIL